MADPDRSKSVPALVAELWELVVSYVKQETVEPVRGLGRFVMWGVAGAIALGLGSVLLVLALLRALQSETGTTFTGNWSWAPYLLTLIVAGVAAAGFASAISKARAKKETRS